MNRSDIDTAPANAVDIENIMQDVRQQILERKLPGQVQLPQTATNLPPEYYEQLYLAGLSQSRLGVELLVTTSAVPVIGPLIDRLRVKIHELVAFYVNRFAAKQAEVNSHVLQALSVLGQPATEGQTDDRLSPNRLGYGLLPQSERATPDDVYACYRLLLGREPDERGWNYWSNLVKNVQVSQSYLVDSFLNGHEFTALREERNRPMLVDLGRFKMFVRPNDSLISAEIARDRRYESHVSTVLESLLQSGDTFIDVGANIGYFALMAASIVGPRGRVIAFEPNADNYEMLRESTRANDFESILTIHPAAVSDMVGMLSFSTGGLEGNGRIVNAVEAEAETIPLPLVQAVTLDDALRECGRIDVIKMDVEGAEARVWRGMSELVRRHKPIIVFEFSPILLQVTSEVAPEAFLEAAQAAYDLYIITRGGDTAAEPQSITAIMENYAASGLTHLDLLARPRP
jgi:FkbM family methyltransferase